MTRAGKVGILCHKKEKCERGRVEVRSIGLCVCIVTFLWYVAFTISRNAIREALQAA